MVKGQTARTWDNSQRKGVFSWSSATWWIQGHHDPSLIRITTDIFPITTPNASVVMSLLCSETAKDYPCLTELSPTSGQDFETAEAVPSFGKGSDTPCAVLCRAHGQRAHLVMPALHPPGTRQLRLGSWACSCCCCFWVSGGQGCEHLHSLLGLHVILQSFRKEAVWCKSGWENLTHHPPTVWRWNYSAQSVGKDRASQRWQSFGQGHTTGEQ